jgi:pyruvate-ferredoxin/flavodoxin oxidoreductase
MDSKAPSLPLTDFLESEVRYTALARTFPEEAKRLMAAAEAQAKSKYAALADMAK